MREDVALGSGRARQETRPGTLVLALFVALTCMVFLPQLGCSSDAQPTAEAAPASDTTREEHLKRQNRVLEIIALLEHTEPYLFEAECLGARPGYIQQACDLARNPQFQGFKKSLVGGVQKLLSIMRDVPELKDKLRIKIVVVVEGRADGIPWKPNSWRKMNQIYGTYSKLAPTFEVPVVQNDPSNWNSILASTRALVVLDDARRQLAEPLRSLEGANEAIESEWGITIAETSMVGANYRGATLRAQIFINIPAGLIPIRVRAVLEENGWTTGVSFEKEEQP